MSVVSSSYPSGTTNPAMPSAVLASASSGDACSSQLDWKRSLQVLREAKLAGVQLTTELMVLLLCNVPSGNSRKVFDVI